MMSAAIGSQQREQSNGVMREKLFCIVLSKTSLAAFIFLDQLQGSDGTGGET